MTDFSTEGLLRGQGIYALTKGDTPGHEFHGNQYASEDSPKTSATGMPSLSQHLQHMQDDGNALTIKSPMSSTGAEGDRSVTVTYHSRQAMGDNNRPARGYTKGEYTVYHGEIPKPGEDKPFPTSREFSHSPQGPGLEGAKGYAADQAASHIDDYLRGRVSKSAITKGDDPGHEFHGNQWTGGQAGAKSVYVGGKAVTMPADAGARDFVPEQTVAQIGRMNIAAISGGRVNQITTKAPGERGSRVVGLDLPVDGGHSVRVFLGNNDTYTVQRIQGDNVKGQQADVYAEDVGEAAYQASSYKSNPFGGHTP